MGRLVEADVAALFDLDGVVADTEGKNGLHNVTWNEALAQHGSSMDRISAEALKMMMGRRPPEIAAIMVEDLGLRVDPADLLQDKESRFAAGINTKLQPMRYAVEAVEGLATAKVPIPVVIVTSTNYARQAAERFGIS